MLIIPIIKYVYLVCDVRMCGFLFYVGCSVVSWFLSSLSLVSFSKYAINMFFYVIFDFQTCAW